MEHQDDWRKHEEGPREVLGSDHELPRKLGNRSKSLGDRSKSLGSSWEVLGSPRRSLGGPGRS